MRQTPFVYLLLTVAVITFAACSSDDDTTPTASTITVVHSDLLFEPQGRTGSVEVNATGTLHAQTNADWCRATTDGMTVYITVEPNMGLEGRTAILTLTAADASLQLPVQQRGAAIGSIAVSDYHASMEGGHVAFYIRHDLPIEVTTDEDWLHPTIQGDSLLLDIDANTTRFIRRGTIRYVCGGYSKELNVAQYDINTVLGTYYLGGDMGGAATGFYFNLVQRDGAYYMNFFRMEEWKEDYVPVDFYEDQCRIVFHSASTIHTTGSGNDVLYFYSPEGSVATSSTATMRADIFYNPVWGSHYAALEDNGTWSGGQLYGLLIRSSRSLISYNLAQLTDPYLVWLGPEGTVPDTGSVGVKSEKTHPQPLP